jgi:hypothetical protein
MSSCSHCCWVSFENPEVIISITLYHRGEQGFGHLIDGRKLSIGDLADVEGLYRLKGLILPPNLMMMLNSCRQNHGQK